MTPRIIFIGPPGSGKGTQAAILAESLGLELLSTGNIFKSMQNEQSVLAESVKTIMASGQLIPDDIVNQVIKEKIQQPQSQPGFILEGYPRTIEQAEYLEKIAPVTKVINIELNDEQSLDRVANRLSCGCGATYNLKTKPPKRDHLCDACGKVLVQRSDDDQEVAAKRLAIFHQQFDPIIAFYRKHATVLDIDGTKAIDDIAKEIKASIK